MAFININERASSSAIARRYTINFFGTSIAVIVTSNPDVARRWLTSSLNLNTRMHTARGRTVVGFGVQWVPFPVHPPAATLQLCIGHHCLIYQLAYADSVPDTVRDFLVSPMVLPVGLWCHSDAGRLMTSWHRVETHEPLDLRYILRRANGENLVDASMEEIVATFLGFQGVYSDPAIEASNWENQELTPDQVRHASVHAYVSFAIGTRARVWEIENLFYDR